MSLDSAVVERPNWALSDMRQVRCFQAGWQMTDADRIAELEAQIAELKAHEEAGAKSMQAFIEAANARAVELEDALIDAVAQGRGHAWRMGCPNRYAPWHRDPSCPACERLDRLVGHRRPKEA